MSLIAIAAYRLNPPTSPQLIRAPGLDSATTLYNPVMTSTTSENSVFVDDDYLHELEDGFAKGQLEGTPRGIYYMTHLGDHARDLDQALYQAQRDELSELIALSVYAAEMLDIYPSGIDTPVPRVRRAILTPALSEATPRTVVHSPTLADSPTLVNSPTATSEGTSMGTSMETWSNTGVKSPTSVSVSSRTATPTVEKQQEAQSVADGGVCAHLHRKLLKGLKAVSKASLGLQQQKKFWKK